MLKHTGGIPGGRDVNNRNANRDSSVLFLCSTRTAFRGEQTDRCQRKMAEIARFHPHTYLLVKVISGIILNTYEGDFMSKERFPDAFRLHELHTCLFWRVASRFFAGCEQARVLTSRYQIWACEMHLCRHRLAQRSSL